MDTNPVASSHLLHLSLVQAHPCAPRGIVLFVPSLTLFLCLPACRARLPPRWLGFMASGLSWHFQVSLRLSAAPAPPTESLSPGTPVSSIPRPLFFSSAFPRCCHFLSLLPIPTTPGTQDKNLNIIAGPPFLIW